jgi:hypothetical protein
MRNGAFIARPACGDGALPETQLLLVAAKNVCGSVLTKAEVRPYYFRCDSWESPSAQAGLAASLGFFFASQISHNFLLLPRPARHQTQLLFTNWAMAI